MDEEHITWLLPSRRDDPTYEPPLHPGIPAHIVDGVENWFRSSVGHLSQFTNETVVLNRLQASTGGEPGRGQFDRSGEDLRLVQLVRGDEQWAIDVVHVTLRDLGSRFGGPHDQHVLRERVRSLWYWLDNGPSEWTVEEWAGTPRLVRRVDDTMSKRAEQLTDDDSNTAQLLRSAWEQAYVRGKVNYNEACRQATRAVEAAARSVVPRSERGKTLGQITYHIRHNESLWSVRAGSTQAVVDQLQWLCELRNPESHADDDTPLPTPEQVTAEAAVQLALTLVHWFRSGAITRIEETEG